MSIFIKKITQMSKELIHLFPEVDPTEFSMLEQATYGLNSEQLSLFASIYRSRRKDPQLVLITCLIGLIGFAGIHRMLVGQIVLGIVYLFTCGLCFIGTIVDLLNYKTHAFEYNEKIMEETLRRIS